MPVMISLPTLCIDSFPQFNLARNTYNIAIKPKIRTAVQLELIIMQEEEQQLDMRQGPTQQDKIIQECVESHDTEKAKFLFNVGAKNIEENVDLKTSLEFSKKFKTFCDKHKNSRSKAQKGSAKSFCKIMDVRECWKMVEDVLRNQNDDEVNNVSLDKQIKKCLLTGMGNSSPSDECFTELYDQVNDLLFFFRTRKKEKMAEDIKAFRPIRYIKHDFDSDRQFQNFISCFQSLPLYEEYKQYEGHNISGIRENFIWTLRKALLSSPVGFSVAVIEEIEKAFEDPMFNFMSLKTLTQDQKQFLYEHCWGKQAILKYAFTLWKPKSIGREVTETIKTIMDFLLENEIIRSSELTDAVEAIKDFDGLKFYHISSITTFRKKIYQEFHKKKPYYFYYKQLGFDKCPAEMKIRFVMSIRKKLHEIKTPHELYQEIEPILLEDRINDLYQLPLRKQQFQDIIKFYKSYSELDSYLKVHHHTIPEEIKARYEMEHILLMLDFKGLEYSDIKKTIDYVIEEKCLPEDILGPLQHKQLVNEFETSKCIKPFLDNLSIDIKQVATKFTRNLSYILAGVPNLIDYETTNKLNQELVGGCQLTSITDSSRLNQNQKDHIKKEVQNSTEFKNLCEAFRAQQSIRAKEQFKAYLNSKFRQFDPDNILFEFYELHGRVCFTAEDTIDPADLKNKQLHRIYSKRAQQLQSIQKSQEYKNFKSFYKFIFYENKSKAYKRSDGMIRKSLSIQGIAGSQINQYMQTLKNNNFSMSSIPERIQKIIQIQIPYVEYQQILDAQQANEVFILQLDLQNKVNELMNSYVLRKYSPSERRDLIDFIHKRGLKHLHETTIVREEEKEAIKVEIESSTQWQNYSKSVQEHEEVKVEEEEYCPKKSQSELCRQIVQKLGSISDLARIKSLTSDEASKLVKGNIFNELGLKQLLRSVGITSLKQNKVKKDIEAIRAEIQPLSQQIISRFGEIIPVLESPEKKKTLPPKGQAVSPVAPLSNGKVEQPVQTNKPRVMTSPKHSQDNSGALNMFKQLLIEVGIKKADDEEILRQLTKINPLSNEESQKAFFLKASIAKLSQKKILKEIKLREGEFLQIFQRLST